MTTNEKTPAPRVPRGGRRWLRWVVVGGLVSTLLLGAVIVVLRLMFHGEALGQYVSDLLNRKMRGRVEIGSIDWPLSALAQGVTGGWIDVTVYDVKVYDDRQPERSLLLHVPKITATVDAHSFLFGNHDFVVEHLEVHGGELTIREEKVREAYKLHPYDEKDYSILSAFRNRPTKQSFRAGVFASGGPVFDLRDIKVRGMKLNIDLPAKETVGTFHDLTIEKGFFYADPRDPLTNTVYYSLEPRAAKGEFHILAEYDIYLEDIAMERLAQLPTKWPDDPVGNDVVYRGTAQTIGAQGPARISIDGVLRDYWEPIYGGTYDVTIQAENVGPLITGEVDSTLMGDNVRATFEIEGPQLRPRYSLVLSGLRYADEIMADKPKLVLDLAQLKAGWDDATEEGYLEDTIAKGSGGEVRLQARFGLVPLRVDATFQITDPLDVSAWVPPQVARALGTELSGGFHVYGDEKSNRDVDRIQLELGPASIKGRLFIDQESVGGLSVWRPEPLQVTLGDTTLTATGQIDFAEEKPELDIVIASGDLKRWLARLDLPPLGHGAAGTARVTGTLDAMLIDAKVELAGVPLVDELATTLTYAAGDSEVEIHDVHTTGLGGRLAGNGKIALGGTPRLVDFHVRGGGVELGRLPMLEGVVSGAAQDIRIDASGPFARLDGHVTVDASELQVLGDGYTGVSLDATSKRGAASIQLNATRKRGGSVDVCTRLDPQQRFLEPDPTCRGVIVRDLALDNMALLKDADGAPLAGGTVNIVVAPQGSMDQLTASGAVRLAQGWLSGAFIGMGDVKLIPQEGGKVGLHGRLFQGNVTFDAVMATSAPFQTEMTAQFHGLDLDAFLPELAAKFGARAWVSGTLTVSMPLAGETPAHGTVVLTQASLSVMRDDELGRPQPLRLENEGKVYLAFAGDTACVDRNRDGKCDAADEEIEPSAAPNLRFAMAKAGVASDGAPTATEAETEADADEPICPEGAHFKGAGGDFCVLGSSRPDSLAVAVRGTVAIDLLAPYLSEYFDSVQGQLRVDVAVRGTLADPLLDATIDVMGVQVQSTGQEAVVAIDNGRIEISNKALSVTNLIVQMEDRFNGEKAELAVRGNVGLKDFRPASWGMQIDGRLAGKMLLAFAPTLVSSASGAADVDVRLQGKGEIPTIDGTIAFETDNPLTFTPRGLRREIVLSGGEIAVIENEKSRALGDKKILIAGVSGKIDEGRLLDVHGEASLVDWELEDIDLTVSAENLPFRVPGTLELTANAENLRIISGRDALAIAGTLVIVDGRYFQRFDPLGDVLRPASTGPPSKPFYESDPLLANADLDLRIDVRSFSVANNIANIEMQGKVKVSGTPHAPKFDDQVTVDRGTFSLPGMRATFTRTSGTVAFSPAKRFPQFTPEMQITSEADFRDSSGVDHLVTLTVSGSLNQISWDLYTSRGLNKAQTIALIFYGQTASELLTDDALDRDPTRNDPSISQQAGYTEQLLRDVAGDLFTDITDDALKNATKLDVFRLEVGTGSFGVHVEKELLPNLDLTSEWELTGQGRVWDSRGTYRILDALSVEGQFTQKRPDDTAEVDTDDLRFRLVYRYILP